MRPIKNLLICLDLTEMDDLIIQYTFYLKQLLSEVKHIHFVHNIRFDNPEDARKITAKLDKPLAEFVIEAIEEKIQPYLDNTPTVPDYTILIEEADSTPTIIAKLAKQNKADLIIAGKKISYKGSGLVVEKLLRVSQFETALLLVPETAYHRIKNILSPTDFSKASKVAIQLATNLARKANAQLSCQHVFSVPSFYFPSMMASDIEPILKNQAEKRWQKFKRELKDISIDELECELSFNWDKNIAQTIYDHAVRNNKDLIIINSKGKGGFAAFMIGSVALKLIQNDLHIPLLIVKSGSKSL